MSVLVVGLSHRTADMAVLERATLSEDGLLELLGAAIDVPSVDEAVLVSTCNRLEIYAAVGKFHAAVAELSETLAKHTGIALDELMPHLYVHYDDSAIAHIYSVAAGLDSMVVGEGQILGQVRAALALAQDQGAAGRVLNEVLQH